VWAACTRFLAVPSSSFFVVVRDQACRCRLGLREGRGPAAGHLTHRMQANWSPCLAAPRYRSSTKKSVEWERVTCKLGTVQRTRRAPLPDLLQEHSAGTGRLKMERPGRRSRLILAFLALACAHHLPAASAAACADIPAALAKHNQYRALHG